MVSYKLIVQLAVRELQIDIFGTPVKVVERLLKDPKRVQEVRAKVMEGTEKLHSRIRALKAAKAEGKPFEEDTDVEIAELETMAAQLDFGIGNDDRMRTCEQFCDSICSTDITDDEGAPMPLEPQALYDSPVPTELLTTILEKVKAEDLVPKQK